jgi:glycosyltransferase involved in cell wall biosynthesis
MQRPLISVLMPTLDSERTIEMCLASIRRQTIGADAVEILVADGGSKDQTRAIARRFGATIMENARVLPEYGISVAMAAAKGPYAITMGSDEVLRNERSFAIKVQLLEENHRVHNVIPGGLKNPAEYPAIGAYVNHFGDPFSYYMHRIDAGDHWQSLSRRYEVVREEADYRVVAIAESQPLPICDGQFFRLAYLRTVADPADPTIVPRLFHLMAECDRLLGVVRNDFIDHYSTAGYRTAKAKIEWRVIGNMHYGDDGSAGYASREDTQPTGFRMKKYFFVPYALSIVAPAVDAIAMAIRTREPAMLYHAPLAVETGLSILKHGVLRVMGIKPPRTAYGKASSFQSRSRDGNDSQR